MIPSSDLNDADSKDEAKTGAGVVTPHDACREAKETAASFGSPVVKTLRPAATSCAPTVAVGALVLLCLGWTLWLIVLTSRPMDMINRLMNTATLDFGAFWRLSEPPAGVVGVGVAGLACVALGYVVVVYKIVLMVWVKRSTPSRGPKAPPASAPDRYSAKVRGYLANKEASPAQPGSASRHWSGSLKRHASRISSVVLDRESATHRSMHTLIKVGDLFIQCVYLVQLLGEGVPVPLIAIFAATVAANAFAAAVFIVLPYDNMGRTHILVDTSFDFIVAVAFPICVLIYSLTTFTFDQRVMDINYESFPPGFFERYAAVVADPVEVTLIRRALDSLRIDSVLKIFTCVGTSAALCRRCFGLIELLQARRAGATAHPNLYPKQRCLLAAAFAVLAVAVVVFAGESVRTSQAACAPHPECVQVAHRWIIGADEADLTRCPCLAVIDSNVTVATYADWVSPPNRTDKIAQLAAQGALQTIQLVNRALPTVPDELRRCKGLKHVSLYYTDTEALPDWFGELTKLEFLHLEGKNMQSFQRLPDNLFDDMPALSYIHLAAHGMPKIPSLDGLTGLKSFTIAVLPFVTELPGLNNQHKLERLTVASMPSLSTFPDLVHIRHLVALVVSDRGAFCCNGFLGADRCDLDHSLCRVHPMWGSPAITQCLGADSVASSATRAYFDQFAYSACYGEALQPGQLKLLPTPDEMVQCNGTMYRECHVPGYNGSAMCYNARWMAVACDPSPFAINMRRLQIARKVGQPCDPAYEAWLGC